MKTASTTTRSDSRAWKHGEPRALFLSVVIPCFNEKESVSRYETELFPCLDGLDVDYEIVAVDDGSADGTAAALQALSQRRPKLRVLTHPRNQGLGAALRTGFASARGEWVVTLDADLTWSPDQIRSLLERQRETGADLVAGSPFLERGCSSGVPWVRRLPSIILNVFYRGFLYRGFTAYTPIFRLYRASALKALPLRSSGFEINAEAAALFLRAGKKLAEIPAVLTVRTEGVSKLDRWRELGRHLRLIASLLR